MPGMHPFIVCGTPDGQKGRHMADLASPLPQTTGVKPKYRKRRITSKTLSLYVLFAPLAILLFLFSYMPIYGIIIAFKEYSPFVGIFGSPWVGFKYFVAFLTDEKFWSVVKNTLIISFLDIGFGFPAPIIFALLANEITNNKFKRPMQTISYLPHFLSWVVVYAVFYQLLSPVYGVINKFLVSAFGMEPINFVGLREWFRPMVVSLEIWKGVGWGAILYFATIAGLDTELYDAAYIDGASRLRQVFAVTLPGMASMIVLMLIFRIANFISVGFERIFVFANPVTYEVADVIAVWVYRRGLVDSQYSLTTAIGLTQSVIGFALLFTANKVASKVAGLGLW
jgi:putative aldouronate transport system permease protein